MVPESLLLQKVPANILLIQHLKSHCKAAYQSKITVQIANLDQIYMAQLKSLKEQEKQPVNTEEKVKALVKQFLDAALTSRKLLVSLIERVELSEEKREHHQIQLP